MMMMMIRTTLLLAHESEYQATTFHPSGKCLHHEACDDLAVRGPMLARDQNTSAALMEALESTAEWRP